MEEMESLHFGILSQEFLIYIVGQSQQIFLQLILREMPSQNLLKQEVKGF